MGMSVQKKFLCGFGCFVLFIGLVGFLIGFFARPNSDSRSCYGAKYGKNYTSGMLAYEKEASKLVSAKRIRHYLKYLANQSLLTETNESCNQAQFIKKEWNSLGVNTVEFKRYNVLLSYPKRPSEVSLVDKNGSVLYSAVVIQKNFNALDDVSRTVFPFSAYSASGIATGKLLYVNYGREKDFKHLQDKNISCAGKIALVRYGMIFEGTKIANAQKWNAAGVLLYMDPAAHFTMNDTLSDVTWYPSDTAYSSGSWVNRGDPLTPGYPATAGIYREQADNVPRPKIPVQPISRAEAEKLLRLLNRTLAPKSWQGGLNFSYRIQMDSSDTRNVTLNVSISAFKQALCNVIGTIKGQTEPDRYVLLGSSRLSSGTALLMEVVRVLMSIKKKGWTPRRTIKVCSWGSENIGSLEWIEEYERLLESRAVAYLNLDTASGIQEKFTMKMKSSPLLERTAFEAAKKVRLPDCSSETLYAEMKRENPIESFSSYIGSDSGCLSFTHTIGVPCAQLIYHSYNYSTSCPFQVALAQLWLQMTFNIAGSLIIPFDVVHYAEVLRTFADKLSACYSGILKENNITLEYLLKAAVDLQTSAKTFEDCLNAVDKDDALQVRMANDRLLHLDRAFIIKEGLPGTPFIKHVVLAPSYFIGTKDCRFPGITNLILTAQASGNENDWERVKKHISIVVHAFRSAVSMLQPPEF